MNKENDEEKYKEDERYRRIRNRREESENES